MSQDFPNWKGYPQLVHSNPNFPTPFLVSWINKSTDSTSPVASKIKKNKAVVVQVNYAFREIEKFSSSLPQRKSFWKYLATLHFDKLTANNFAN